MKNKKGILSFFIIIGLIVVLELTGALPYFVSRIASKIYVESNYKNENLKFIDSEYAYGFGDYFVRYKAEEGENEELGLMMFPKEFPIFVRYDSKKKDLDN